MKRKHPTSVAAASTGKSAKSSAATSQSRRPAQPQTKQQKAAKQSRFAQPMRRLDSDSDEENQGYESNMHDRRHMQQIDADADASEESADDDDDDEDGEEAPASEDDDAEEVADEEDEEEEAGEDDADDVDDAVDVASSASESDPELESDLPLQLVQATYSGVLYGLKSKLSVRQMCTYHTAGQSKRGIDDSDIDDDEDAEEEEDEEDAEMAADDEEATEEQKDATAAPASSSSPSTPAFDLLFTNAAHIGSIKSLSVSGDGKWTVSGGLDETIKIFKTAVMREFGQLHAHTGSVVALEFYGSSFLLSGGQEGDLCIWSTKTWQLMRKFASAHVGAPGSLGGVSCLAVHPSGRVALSVGATDRKVKLWDLMKGTLASERTLDFVCTSVRWAIGGEAYVLMGDKRVDVYDTSNTLIRREQVADTKLLAVTWISSALFALGCEDKSVRIHSATTGACVATLQAHQARVRGLDAITIGMSANDDSIRSTFLASASTDGQTHLWDLTALVADGDSAAATSFHPICSSFHDQRVTQLRILPQWSARKDDESLKKPVQTAAAAQKQAEMMAKKAAKANGDTNDNSAKKATRETAAMAKAKKLFEKGQRSQAARDAAKEKAKRALARVAPNATEEVAVEVTKKKAKTTFEEAPLADSDQEAEETAMPADEDDEDDDDEEESAEPAPVQSKSAGRAAPAAAPKKSSKPAKSVPAAKSSSGDHSGFSAAIPLFRPQLNQQRKKKKSAAKVSRDAERQRVRR